MTLTFEPKDIEQVILAFIFLFFKFIWVHQALVVTEGLSCPMACGILLPRAGTEPVSPALGGRFFTTGLSGKSLILAFMRLGFSTCKRGVIFIAPLFIITKTCKQPKGPSWGTHTQTQWNTTQP